MSIESFEDQVYTYTDMGSNLSRRRGNRHQEDYTSPLIITRDDDFEPRRDVAQEYELQTQSELSPPLLFDDEDLMDVDEPPSLALPDDFLPPLVPHHAPPLEPQQDFQQEVGLAIARNSSPRVDGQQPTVRLSIIYFIPHRRGRGEPEGPSLEEAFNGDQPFTGEMLGRVLFAMTIPIGGGNNSSPFQMTSFDDLLDRLLRQHVPQGPPPTSKTVLQKLPISTVDATLLHETCLVCQEAFQMEETAISLPCHHHFHKDCVTPWLEQHCTCPTCRYELPVDDKEYETERKKRMADRNIDETFNDIIQEEEMAEVTDMDEITNNELNVEDVQENTAEPSYAEMAQRKFAERQNLSNSGDVTHTTEVSP